METVRAQRDELRREKDEQAPKLAACVSEIDDMSDRLSSLQKLTSDLRAEIRDDKEQCASLTDAVESEKFKVVHIRSEVDRISTQIVRSPARYHGVMFSRPPRSYRRKLG